MNTYPIKQSMRKLFKVMLLIIAATMPFATVTAANNNLTDEAMQAYNEKIFIVPPIPQN